MLFKDSASRVKCKIKARETIFYFQFRGTVRSFLYIMFKRWPESGKMAGGGVGLFAMFQLPFQKVIF